VSSNSHATTQNQIWMQSLCIMIVPCNCCLLLELSVSPVLAHTLWTDGWIYCIFMSLSVRQTTHCTSSTSDFHQNCREADGFQATPTLLTTPQYVCITLRYQPFSLNIVCPFPSPQNAVTEILDDLHKHQQSS